MFSIQTIIITGVVFWLLTCIAIIDVARKDFGSIEKKAAWGFTAFIPFLGVVIYFLFGYKKGVLKSKKSADPPAQIAP